MLVLVCCCTSSHLSQLMLSQVQLPCHFQESPSHRKCPGPLAFSTNLSNHSSVIFLQPLVQEFYCICIHYSTPNLILEAWRMPKESLAISLCWKDREARLQYRWRIKSPESAIATTTKKVNAFINSRQKAIAFPQNFLISSPTLQDASYWWGWYIVGFSLLS